MTNETNQFYLVRAENSGEPESYVFGLYDNKLDALNRIKVINEGYDYIWYDVVTVGDLELCNR